MTIKTTGVDLAKQVFQIHGVDETGHVLLRKHLSRGSFRSFFPISHLAWLAWRHVAVLISGHGNSNSLAMMSV